MTPIGVIPYPGHFPWLTVLTFMPLAGALALAFVPRSRHVVARWWALAVTVATFAVSVGMFAVFRAGQAGYQLVDRTTWVKSLHLTYVVGVDGISLFLVLLTTFLLPLAILASWRLERSAKAYFMSFLVLETTILGSFLSLDLLLFFVFFEALLVPTYLIIAGWGGERRAYAALKFFIFTMGGSAFLLAAILYLYAKTGTFQFTGLIHGGFGRDTARWLFMGFFVAFAVKVPLVPLSTWQPDAYEQAPTGGTLVLAALLAKVGAYGMIRFNLTMFPEASGYFRTFVLVLAVVAILYGAIAAIVQTDMKRLIAYSSMSHMGFIVLGIFAFSLQGASGSVLYMVNHGLSTGALFLIAAMLADRIGTNDLRRMGGLAARVPVLAGVFLFMALASVGLPGLNNFVSEFLVLLGTFVTGQPWAVAAVIAVVLSAVYMLGAYQRAFHGTPAIAGGSGDAPSNGHGDAGSAAPARPLRDLHPLDYAIVVPLIAAVLFLGLYPKPVLSRIGTATTRLVACVEPWLNNHAGASGDGGGCGSYDPGFDRLPPLPGRGEP
jgi:NADH-quinone oxidoreductase subunit M